MACMKMRGEVLRMSLFVILAILHMKMRAIVIVRIGGIGLGMILGLLFLSIQNFLLTRLRSFQ